MYKNVCLKMIEVQSNVLFLSVFGVKNWRTRVSRMCENACLSIKNPKACRTLKQVLDPGRRLLASLAQLHFTMATFGLRNWAPLDQILHPHLKSHPQPYPLGHVHTYLL